MNRARGFSNSFPAEVTGIAETILPGGSYIIPLLGSLLGFNFVDYVWKNIVLGVVDFCTSSIRVRLDEPLGRDMIDWLTEDFVNKRGLGSGARNLTVTTKDPPFGETRTRITGVGTSRSSSN